MDIMSRQQTKAMSNICVLRLLFQARKVYYNKLRAFSSGLLCIDIGNIEAHATINQKLTNRNEFIVWHNWLGHPGSIMMQRIIKNSCGYSLTNQKILQTNEFSCPTCTQGKLIIKLSPAKIGTKSLGFLEHIHGDIWGPIQPPSRPFRYFMVLIVASTRWSHVCLLSTRNLAFVRLLTQLIRLRAPFLDNPIKTTRLDNSGEFTSQAFNDYCTAIRIIVEHLVAHVHTQNGLVE